MAWVSTMDTDHVLARLHGRRSRFAVAGRHDELRRAATVEALAAELLPDAQARTASELQRVLVARSAAEISDLARQFRGCPRAFLSWLLARWGLENLKTILRAFLSGRNSGETEHLLLPLPDRPAFDTASLLGADNFRTFCHRIRNGVFRDSLVASSVETAAVAHLFLAETHLDHGYLRELLRVSHTLSATDRDEIKELVDQESCAFLLALVARSRFGFGLARERLQHFHIAGASMLRWRFAAMLSAADLESAARLAVGYALDEVPAPCTPATLEASTWRRFERLANRAFRRGHMSFGAAVGFVALRRMELAILITRIESVRIQEGAMASPLHQAHAARWEETARA